MQRAFICGLAGHSLAADEKNFLAEARPAGIIIFARNVADPGQVKRLIAEARAAAGGEKRFLVLVDQEGGRVQRLSAPHWRKYPAAEAFAKAYPGDEEQAARCAYLCTRLIANDLHRLGINSCCAPVLDIPVAGADKVIGDRAYGVDAASVTRLGEAAAKALLAGGILPIMKHIPGHGRAMADSHFSLPAVGESIGTLEESDFKPFKSLNYLPMAMTAHIVLEAVDRSAPVTISRKAIQRIVRGIIGFDGLLMSDDVSMRALSGGIRSRAEAAIGAGCDIVLHCNGKLDEMEDVAAAVPALASKALDRFHTAFQHLREPETFDGAEAEQALAVSLAALA